MTAKTLWIAALACLLGASLGRTAEDWGTDWEQAKASAAQNRKDILLEFTGSDWCPWCIKLKKEVLTTEAFTAYAAANLVLMEADFPRKTKLSPELSKQNQKLHESFGIGSFPTVVLTDAQGRPVASTTYRAGGAEPYLQFLREGAKARAQRDELLAQANGTQGLDRAKLLAAALAPLPAAFLGFYRDITQEIQDLDKDNQTGFKARLTALEQFGLGRQVQSLGRAGKTAEALAKVDAYIAANPTTGEPLQQAQMMKLGAYPPNTLANLAAADALLDQIIAVDPATATAKQGLTLKERNLRTKAQLEAKAAAKPPATPAP